MGAKIYPHRYAGIFARFTAARPHPPHGSAKTERLCNHHTHVDLPTPGCEFQGLNVVIYSQYRQNFRACSGLGGNLITPSRTRPPVGARLVVRRPIGWPLRALKSLNVSSLRITVGRTGYRNVARNRDRSPPRVAANRHTRTPRRTGETAWINDEKRAVARRHSTRGPGAE